MISDEALKSFKEAWKSEFNEEISDQYAIEAATTLLNLFNHIYKPLKKSWVEEVSEGKKSLNKTL